MRRVFVSLSVTVVVVYHDYGGKALVYKSQCCTKELFVHLAYLDDSGGKDRKYQVVAAIVVDDMNLDHLEDVFATVREFGVPEQFQESFEVHAADLFNQRGRFKDIEPAKALEILASCVKFISVRKYPLFYGAVDLDKHREGHFGNADPITVGFRMCLDAIRGWMFVNAPRQMCIPVFDMGSPEQRRQLHEAFRTCRKRLNAMEGSKGKWDNFVDDLYFGDSAFSVGIQAADVCAFFINRHLHQRQDTENLYQLLEPHIAYGEVLPK